MPASKMSFWSLCPRPAAWGRAWLVCAALLTGGAAQAVDLHGVHLPDNDQVAGRAVVLNGAGTRRFLVFKVYVVGLYLPERTHSAQQALDMAGPKQIRLTMLRTVSGEELGTKLDEGIHDNVSAQQRAALAAPLTRLRAAFAQHPEVREGENVVLRYEPGTGTLVQVDGVTQEPPYAGEDFFRALLSVWLGQHPADAALKRDLLGGSGAAG